MISEEKWKGFLELKKDWDSYGAGPIEPRAVEIGRKIEAALSPSEGEFAVVPTVSGGGSARVASGWIRSGD